MLEELNLIPIAKEFEVSVRVIELSDATRQTYRGILERFRVDYGDHPVARLEEQHITAITGKKATAPAAANNLRRMAEGVSVNIEFGRTLAHLHKPL